MVHPLGFVNNMADYMVAADILVSKAGPGTIAEAACVGLPVLLTSFLPGMYKSHNSRGN
jgi:1,2-diacylglycerol 3-beta-galactosyltransferase